MLCLQRNIHNLQDWSIFIFYSFFTEFTHFPPRTVRDQRMECSASRSSPAIFQECHTLHITIVQGTPLHTAVQGVVPLQWRAWGCQSSFILHITWILSRYCFTHTCYYLTTCIVEEPPAICWRTVPVHWSLQSIEVCALSIKKKCVQYDTIRYEMLF